METFIGCDFDKTVYNGNSAIDFFLFCMKKSDGLRWFFFKHLGNYIKYLIGIQNFDRNTEKFYLFLPVLADIDSMIEEFWDKHMHKLKEWFLKLDMRHVLILTASASFLMESLQKRIGFRSYVATTVDRYTGIVDGVTCLGEEKVRRFRAQFPDGRLAAFFSDSRKDQPLAHLAERAYLVKRDTIRDWEP